MFRIQLYESPAWPSTAARRLVQDNVSEMSERADAVRYMQDYIAQYDRSGYDDEQDSWWCRNDGDKEVKILVICAN